MNQHGKDHAGKCTVPTLFDKAHGHKKNQWRSPNNVNCDVIFYNALKNAVHFAGRTGIPKDHIPMKSNEIVKGRTDQWRSPNNVNCDVIFYNALQNAMQNALQNAL